MPSKLPPMSKQAFESALVTLSPEPLAAATAAALYIHYLELARWNERLALIGPGTTDEVLERHYGEALAALPLIPPSARRGVDVGSGAGFPGLVLAAARPGLEMTLIEAQERKWSFLVTAARKAALPCRCLNVRVASPLPAGVPKQIDLVTVRALKLEPEVLGALARRLSAEGSMLLWIGELEPRLPRDLVPHVSVPLPGAERRRILQLRPAGTIVTSTGTGTGRPLPEAATGGDRHDRPARSATREPEIR
jgi:16S rRNA (guanine(527)-N(7))-methyltransferase RsmG